MVWLLGGLFIISAIGSVWNSCRLSKLKRLSEESEHWDMRNFRKIECGYVKGDDIGAKPEKWESFFVQGRHIHGFIDNILGRREIMFRATGETLVSINVFGLELCNLKEEIEVRFCFVDSPESWSAMQEFLKQILRDLNYREDVTGNWSEVWVYPDLRILLGFENDQMISDWMRCTRLSEHNGRFISVDDLNKLQCIRKVMDLHKTWFPVGKTVFNFLMNKHVGLCCNDQRVIDLIATDEGLTKVCNYFPTYRPPPLSI